MSVYNLRNPAVKRLMKEAEELSHATDEYHAQPLEDNLFEWHFSIRGPPNSDFEGGIYHGRITLPPDYPMKPPSIILLTPNGRFETNKKICLSISGYHPESWQPSWSIRTALLAIIGFMPTHGNGALGSLDYTPAERKELAVKSQEFKCPDCGSIKEIFLKKQSSELANGTAATKLPSNIVEFSTSDEESHKKSEKDITTPDGESHKKSEKDISTPDGESHKKSEKDITMPDEESNKKFEKDITTSDIESHKKFKKDIMTSDEEDHKNSEKDITTVDEKSHKNSDKDIITSHEECHKKLDKGITLDSPVYLSNEGDEDNKQSEEALVIGSKRKPDFYDSKSAKMKLTDETTDLVRDVDVHRKQRDECYIYGKYVAAHLRNYNALTRSVVKHLIGNILFRADIGQLNLNVSSANNSHCFFSTLPTSTVQMQHNNPTQTQIYTPPVTQYSHVASGSSHMGNTIPNMFSNPAISGLFRQNPGIPGLLAQSPRIRGLFGQNLRIPGLIPKFSK